MKSILPINMHSISRETGYTGTIAQRPRRCLAEAIAVVLAGGLMAGSVSAQDFPAIIELGSLDGQIGFRVDGVSEADNAGEFVHQAGDVNGDGIDDFIVGAFLADPNDNNWAGSSYVVFGRETAIGGPFDPVLALSSLDGTNGFRIDGVDERHYSGHSVSAAGDINGDGLDDVIIGAFGAGSSYVVFGRNTLQQGAFPPVLALSSLDGDIGFRLNNDFPGSTRSGFSVSGGGDINGDGIDDMLIADATAFGGTTRGHIVYGKVTSTQGPFPAVFDLPDINGANGVRIEGALVDDSTARSISMAGDINGDGIDDLILGSPFTSPNDLNYSGSAFVLFGQDSAGPNALPSVVELANLDGSDGFRLNGVHPYDYTGRVVSSTGDINGDGIDDVVISADRADPNGDDSGSVYVVFGRDIVEQGDFPPVLELSTLGGASGFRIDGSNTLDWIGDSVGSAGDVNADGLDDLIIGSRAPGSGGFGSGVSYVLFGRDTALTGPFPNPLVLSSLNGSNGFRLDGENAFDFSGRSVSTAGDINGDGVSDLIIGAPVTDNSAQGSGSAYVVFGGNDGPGSGRIELQADQTLIDFGPVQIGQSLSGRITLSNQASTEPVIGQLIIEGSPGYTILNDTCSGQTLGTTPGSDDGCSFDVEFSATDGGVQTARAVVPYNSSLGPEIILLRAFPDGLLVDGFESD